jgi:hypothetical protein
VSNQPSDAYRQHYDVEAPRVDWRAFRQGWRVRSRLDRLLDDGRITPGEWQAASEYRDAWDALRRTSRGGGGDSGPRVAGYGGDRNARAAAIDRAARIRAAEDSIGPDAAGLCQACAVEDLSWRALGARLGVRDVTAMGRTVDALRALARAWRRAWTERGTIATTGGAGRGVYAPSRPSHGRADPVRGSG